MPRKKDVIIKVKMPSPQRFNYDRKACKKIDKGEFRRIFKQKKLNYGANFSKNNLLISLENYLDKLKNDLSGTTTASTQDYKDHANAFKAACSIILDAHKNIGAPNTKNSIIVPFSNFLTEIKPSKGHNIKFVTYIEFLNLISLYREFSCHYLKKTKKLSSKPSKKDLDLHGIIIKLNGILSVYGIKPSSNFNSHYYKIIAICLKSLNISHPRNLTDYINVLK